LPTGEGAHRVGGAVEEADVGERGGDRGPVGAAGRPQEAAPGQPAGGDHLADGGRHAAAGAEALGDVPDAPPLPEPPQRRAEQPDLAGAHRQQPEDGLDQRGLAGPVGAEDRDHLAGLDPQRDGAQNGPAVVRDDQPGGVHGCHVHPSAARRTVRLVRITDR
jgi:hypothetical protein